MTNEPRLPDFLIIGAMKCGTTSLFRWLGEQPGVSIPEIKEPHFFSRKERWDRGLNWYGSLFLGAPDGALTGEASASYSDPRLSSTAAKRIAGVVPHARLIYLVRDPVERIRSHYRHEIQRARERRPLVEALRDPDNPYLRSSLYHRALSPYLERFPREQILVTRLEDLAEGSGWRSVLTHIGLPDRPRPQGEHNVSDQKAGFTRPMLRLWESGLAGRAAKLPKPIRRLGKRLLMRHNGRYGGRVSGSLAPIPADLLEPLWDDGARLAAWLGRTPPLWDHNGDGRGA
jgi:Sulfotransferase domain